MLFDDLSWSEKVLIKGILDQWEVTLRSRTDAEFTSFLKMAPSDSLRFSLLLEMLFVRAKLETQQSGMEGAIQQLQDAMQDFPELTSTSGDFELLLGRFFVHLTETGNSIMALEFEEFFRGLKHLTVGLHQALDECWPVRLAMGKAILPCAFDRPIMICRPSGQDPDAAFVQEKALTRVFLGSRNDKRYSRKHAHLRRLDKSHVRISNMSQGSPLVADHGELLGPKTTTIRQLPFQMRIVDKVICVQAGDTLN